jgi:AraC family ethanolamine operon transcriptional activator
MQFVQIDSGRFCASASCIQSPGVLKRLVQTDRKIQARGIPCGSRYVFTLITEANEFWRFQGCRRLRPGDIKIDRPGSARYEIYDAGSAGRSVEIDETMLREALAINFQKKLDTVLPHGFAIRPTPRAFRAFQSRLSQSARGRACGHPKHADCDAAAQVVGLDLDAVCRLLVDDVRQVEPIRPHGGRLDLAREAEEIMDTFPHRPLTTTQLCHQLCVSRRSLFYAFHEAFGVSPMAYYKVKRLALVRTQLKALDPASTTVRAVALRMGFRHAGQFARDYFVQFGELPSDTLLNGRLPAPGSSHRSDQALVAALVTCPN